ncbi:winged helix-turn-helix domain-containing protein [Nocardioides plantarum]|uniref:Winged helix-turn-helix domain-containing protein n=1 Tax=Nocardioides plantarum TaxID=29299 RepID=A0ABV5K719_9ACTN|nr:helix-turn-helix domain-containing protein [Nocardioides plantarum]
MPEPTVLHDPLVLRAIAHPVRNRILDELAAQGSMRAADIARELDIPANQASFHLRQLAKYGLVVEDPEAARDKRDRVWRVAHEGGLSISYDDFTDQPGGAAALDVYQRNAVAWAQYVVQQAHLGERGDDGMRSVGESTLRLTKDEARALNDELLDVVDRWSRRTRGGDGEGRRTYLYFSALQPHPGRGGPGGGTEPGE